jgi:hypothetical protein
MNSAQSNRRGQSPANNENAAARRRFFAWRKFFGAPVVTDRLQLIAYGTLTGQPIAVPLKSAATTEGIDRNLQGNPKPCFNSKPGFDCKLAFYCKLSFYGRRR